MNTHSNQLTSDVALWPASTSRRTKLRAARAQSLFGLAATFLAVLGAVSLWSPAAAGAAATPTNAGSPLSLEAFKIITQRNIFDQNRRPGAGPRPVRVERRAPRIEAFSLVGTLLHEEGIYAFFDGSGSDYRKVCKPGEMIAGYKVAEVTIDSCKLVATNETIVELPLGMQMRRQDEEQWQVVVGTAASSSSASDSSSGGRERSPEFGGRERGPSSSFNGGRDRSSPGGRRDRSSFSFNNRRERGPASTGSSAADSEPAADLATDATPEAKPAAEQGSDAGADEVLKRLMQKREQELNK